MEKKCFKCGDTKPIDQFYKHSQMGDGHLNKCKDCTKLDVKTQRQANPEHYREYDRTRGNRQGYEYTKKYRALNPDKTKAHHMVNNRVHRGTMVKKTECEECGSTFAIEAHHEDYSKPLDVTWLCSACHKKRHFDVVSIGASTASLRV